ncbi:MAG: hypothetical protein HY898_08230 [Deltaproteobacteria bacterium]|nr:hypothetical protein [Deltaproteobacteria bacterium]
MVRPGIFLRGAASFTVLSLAAGCSLVWDIERADLDPATVNAGDASTEAPAADAKQEVKPAPGCTASGEACADCIASSCCEPYNSCLEDSACNAALVTYDLCAAAAPDGGGSTCAETFGTASAIAQSLVQCAFLSKCSSECSYKRLRSSCDEYCACMQSSCPGAAFTQGTCLESCPLLSTVQLDCRAYHCQFAASDPGTHCPHAEGLKVCP